MQVLINILLGGLCVAGILFTIILILALIQVMIESIKENKKSKK